MTQIQHRNIEPHRGGLLLGLAIIGMLFPPLAVVAWCMAYRDKKKMEQGLMDDKDGGLTMLAAILGTLVILGVLLMVSLFVLSIVISADNVLRSPR